MTIAGTEITGLDDARMTLLRRERIGFVFQFFNLFPILSANENVLLPALISGPAPGSSVVAGELLGSPGLAAAATIAPPSSAAASCNAWRWPGR